MKGLFVFRRDLRVPDNTGLLWLSKKCSVVNCIFILDPLQIDPKKNKFYSANAMLFMIDSLLELKKEIPLKILYGGPIKIIAELHNAYDIISYNADYSKYAVARDSKLDATEHHDLCLNSPLDIPAYKVFTPYYNVAVKNPVRKPQTFIPSNIHDFKHKSVDLHKLRAQVVRLIHAMGADINLIQPGGRSNGLRLCNAKLINYELNRDLLTYETSRLSPHLKFGTLSVREVYYARRSVAFRRQLYWRDFYMQIGYHFNKVYGANFRHNIKWVNNPKHFRAWCEGKTGYDIIDACMLQLNKSGYMHNRGRMIVANFLTKILHIDWRLGERYFASRLTDYDPASNNGGWQWSAGTGVDAQPYYRIFNPTIQADKFDPNAEYRKKWLTRAKVEPIVDYDVERVAALKLAE